MLILKPANVATPDTAGTVTVPDSVPPPKFVPIATVTLAAKLGTVLPNASRALTWTAGVMLVPATAVDGSTEKASCDAAAGLIENPFDVAPVSDVAVAASV